MPKTFFFLLVFYSTTVAAQKRFFINPSSLDIKLVKLKAGLSPKNLMLPISSISVVDARYDTGKIGFIVNKDAVMRRRISRRLVVDGGLAKAATNFYNSYYVNSLSKDSLRLLVVIKKLWADPQPNRNLQAADNGIDRSSLFDIYAKFEFLLQNGDKCFPIKRVDTLFQWPANISNVEFNAHKDEGYSEYEYVLIKMLESLNLNYYTSRIESIARWKTYDEILLYNQSRFNLPVLKDSFINSGVYLSFQDFKNNKPSITAFKVKADRKAGNMIFRAMEKDSSQIVKYWGFCDGRFIYFSDVKHPLMKAGNTFEFFNDLRIRRLTYANSMNPGIPNVSVPVTSEEEILEPFQLDMDTGRIY